MCKIIRLSKFMLHGIMRLTKIQTFEFYIYYYSPVTQAIHEKAQWNMFTYSYFIIIIFKIWNLIIIVIRCKYNVLFI